MSNDLSRRLRLNPKVNGMANALTKTRQRASALKKEIDQSLTPAEVTMYVQAGAALAGASEALLQEKQATGAQLFGSIGAMGMGSVMELPWLVAMGNGMVASTTKEQVKRLLTKNDGRGRDERDVIPDERERERFDDERVNGDGPVRARR